MISPGAYAVWRARSCAAQKLADQPDGGPLSEHILQLIWLHQRLRRAELHTQSGQPVTILHPGFWNHEPGPDFRDAVIQFGDTLAKNGDVEIDLTSQNWHAHGHDQNPAFKHVILHVVWEVGATATPPLPTLALKPHLDAPIEELALWLRHEPRPGAPNLEGSCAAPFQTLPVDERTELLRQAAQIRLETKAGHFCARARQTGWEQALWEGLFGALGYKHNAWPMRRISELLPFFSSAGQLRPASALAWQARLLGISGLLPNDLRSGYSPARAHLQKLWDLWWRERDQFAEMALPPSLWRLSSLRPANNPQRRLALAAHWLAQADLAPRLTEWFASAQPDTHLASSLMKILQTGEDEFWSRHWTFRSKPMTEPQPMIGAQRLTDLAINVILPWFWIRAVTGGNQAWQRRAEKCYFAWPKAEDNAVLRLARHRLFGTAREPGLNTAALQQGVLQIVRDFCDFSNALCDNCPFPILIQT